MNDDDGSSGQEEVKDEPLTSLPAATERLDEAAPRYFRAQIALRCVVYTGIAGAVALPTVMAGKVPFTVAATALSLLLFVFTAWLIVVPRLRHERFRFGIDDRLLLAKDGVFVRREIVIPVSRMQHLDIERGPLERAFGLATLSVFTAGGLAATFRLPALDPARADRLRLRIVAAREANVHAKVITEAALALE